MTVREIQQSINRHFKTHKYELNNSYVFDWESDFFSITTSGYAYEVEIKLSRSDFFADFKKDKHKLFKMVKEGKTGYWLNSGPSFEGDRINIRYKKMERRGRHYDRYGRYGEKLDDGITYDWRTDKYLTNQWQDYFLFDKIINSNIQGTRIRYVDLTTKNLPNKFIYACPKALIKPDEVPDYAGLMYVDAFNCQVVKAAPFIHKRVMDLKAMLLEKFYYECLRLRPLVKK